MAKTATTEGWSRLFTSAFRGSRNAMLLTDEGRIILDANGAFVTLVGRGRESLIGRPVSTLVVEGPLLSDGEWAQSIGAGRFDGEAQLRGEDGGAVAVQWAANVETVTAGRRVLFVALSTSRWGARFRRDIAFGRPSRGLSPRELEVVHLVSLGAAGPPIAAGAPISPETGGGHPPNAREKHGGRARARRCAPAPRE